MLYRVIDADKLSSLVRGFMNDYEVIAPVKRDQGYVFAVIHLSLIHISEPTRH